MSGGFPGLFAEDAQPRSRRPEARRETAALRPPATGFGRRRCGSISACLNTPTIGRASTTAQRY